MVIRCNSEIYDDISYGEKFHNICKSNSGYYFVNGKYRDANNFRVIKEENMKVKCIDKYYSEIITVGKEYDVMGESETHYAIANDEEYIVSYLKKYFEPIKGNGMKMIVKDWKDLDGTRLNLGYVINSKYYKEYMILGHQTFSNIYLPHDLGKENILRILSAFGLEVEFGKEQTITQNDYNFIEIYCNNQDEATITKAEKDGYVFIGSLKMPLSWKLFESLEYGKPYFVSDLRKFRVEG
jgi:hypothetical protein